MMLGVRNDSTFIEWQDRKNREMCWSTGRELNPRILVLQTSALATSPPVLIALLSKKHQRFDLSKETPPKEKSHQLREQAGYV
jgi:hypothetical protein